MNDMLIFFGFVIGVTLVLSFIRKYTKDECLKDFEKQQVALLFSDGTYVEGYLRVENTGIEVIHLPSKPSLASSTLIYSHEYPHIIAFIRYLDTLTPDMEDLRKDSIADIYNPTFFLKIRRMMLTPLRRARDGILEVLQITANVMTSKSSLKKFIPAQQKSTTLLNTELVSFIGTAYDPLIETHIGKEVILESKDDPNFLDNTSGLLKSYSSTFLELIDVNLTLPHATHPRQADIIVHRERCVVRHGGKTVPHIDL
jgi:hypothetical protein